MLYERVEALCKERGISIARLERECDIGNSTIKAWEKSSPRVDTLKKVASYFGVPINYFTDDEEAK